MSAVQAMPGQGFTLVMTLEDPAAVGSLREWLSKPDTIERIHAALKPLRTLHYARFLPIEKLGHLLLVAEFDGERDAFMAALGSGLDFVFVHLLPAVKDVPPAPGTAPGDAFRALVQAGQGSPQLPKTIDLPPFCAYAGKTVEDILGGQDAFPQAPAAPGTAPGGDPRQPQVSGAFNLVMQLENPLQITELLARLADPYTKLRIDTALASLDYVHYARFQPLFQCGALMILTEFDGVMQDYVMDFAAALDREFSFIIACMNGRPPLPVSEYPNEFWTYVAGNLVQDTGLYAAYPGKTVLDIVGSAKPKLLPEKPVVPAAPVNKADVQANVLHGFGATRAWHYYLGFPDPAQGRAFVRALKVNNALEQPTATSTCCTLGFTFAGLAQLGLRPEVLGAFPEAFRQGPAGRAARNADADPKDWTFGKPPQPGEPEVHAVLSLYARSKAEGDAALQALDKLITAHELHTLHEDGPQGEKTLYARKAEALADTPRAVHFGYRDGISQPRIAGVHAPAPGRTGTDAMPGDFLLGHAYYNSRGGRYIGRLVEPLARNATYAAYRVIEQDTHTFEQWLDQTAADKGITTELLAAKLMGRWKDGTPLTRHGTKALGEAIKDDTPLDDFDYISPAEVGDGGDAAGQRCPIGAHVRRFNPRGGMVLGLPWGRLVLRRGLPFGPRHEGGKPDKVSRGLVGMFLCGDLEAQFEFLLGAWGRRDLSSFGLRHTQDPFTNTADTPFRFTVDGHAIEVQVPPLTKTLGSLYLFMPGIEGLRWIGEGQWLLDPTAPPPRAAPAPDFDPHADGFRTDPYPQYAQFRQREPVKKIGHGHDRYWVLTHALITEVCRPENQLLFLKPGHNREPVPRPFGIAGNTDDGLFFMDPPRHSAVRPALDKVFLNAIAPVVPDLQAQAELLIAPMKDGTTVDVVATYAARIAVWAFMKTVGIPPGGEQAMVELWTRQMLAGAGPLAAPTPLGVLGGTASLALRAYLAGLSREQKLPPAGCGAAAPTVMAGLHQLSACPMLDPPLNADEVTNSGSHFALGGYLSTEFLITTGLYNLLRHPGQWKRLHDEPALIENAVWEMLRFDAPFQMADRWVAQDCRLGEVALKAGDKLTVVYGSANHDESVFTVEPERFDITRECKPEQVYGFGHGIHRCIGAPLAVEVAKAAVLAIVQRFPKAALAGEAGSWLPNPYFRSRTEVPVALG